MGVNNQFSISLYVQYLLINTVCTVLMQHPNILQYCTVHAEYIWYAELSLPGWGGGRQGAVKVGAEVHSEERYEFVKVY